MTTNKDAFVPQNFYHVFNRTNGGEKLFRSRENYRYFMQQFSKYILPIADVYACNLIPNHFHFLIQIKDVPLLEIHYLKLYGKVPSNADWVDKFITQQFSNLFNSYAKAFNKMYGRSGSLSQESVCRKEVNSDEQFSATIFYIHKNAMHHGCCKTMEGWPYSSYNKIISGVDTMIQRKKVIEWFGGLERFIEYHRQPVHLKKAVVIE